MRVKIIDYGTIKQKPQDKVVLNLGVGIARTLNIQGINSQKLTVMISVDGFNFNTLKNDDGSNYIIDKDDSIPFIKNDVYLALESDTDPTGIVASIGIKG